MTDRSAGRSHGPGAVLRYMTEMSKVDGWLTNTTAHVIRNLLEHQAERGVTGDVLEIGVHHGRLFILLCLATAHNEKAIAVDLFDMQHLNIDNSGMGDAGILQANLATFAPNAVVDYIKGDSVALAEEIKAKLSGSIRYISVDGGHTRNITCSDLFVAQTIAREGAVVSLDDIYRVEWSGVTAGLARYFAQGGTLVPFCISPNKVHFTTNAHWAGIYRAHIERNLVMGPSAEFFEFDDVVLVPEDAQWEPETWLRTQLPIYGTLKDAADTLWKEKTVLWDELLKLRASQAM